MCGAGFKSQRSAGHAHGSWSRAVQPDAARGGDPGSGYFVATTQAATSVGSFTGRITYDSTALRFEAEIPLEGDALRVSNASGGAPVSAGASAGGFTDGRLAGWRFTVIDPAGVKTLRLVVDEIHTVARNDARNNLILAPTRGTIQ